MNRMKQLRQQKGLSLRKLAEDIHSNRTTLWRIENDEAFLTEDMIISLCDVFECSADYLLGISDIQSYDGYLSPSNYLFALYKETKDLSKDERNDVLGFVQQALKLMKK